VIKEYRFSLNKFIYFLKRILMSYFIIAFMIILPVAEIWILIKLGGYFGAFGTLALIIGTAGLGILIAKHQGLGILYNLQSKLSQGKKALHEVVEGVVLLIGAFFFLVPGAITDLIGICLIVPQLRRFIIGIMVNKIIFEMRKRESRS
jgi:UPF0716 protein FxsA|tara:strand:+ start:415 stop:858 length:444 start_codon:yes stop_codon:yes gene_type:complete